MNDDPKLLYPLDVVYAQVGAPLPPASRIAGEEVPEPYKQLLVHRNDMTPTLEAFHGDRIHLRVSRWRLEGESYLRQVVLLLNGSDRPVEFGAIVIHTDRFPPAAREVILEGQSPLGTILATHGIEHTSCPQAFLRVLSNDGINEALGLSPPQVLYGRRNVLSDSGGEKRAEVLEILPPLTAGA